MEITNEQRSVLASCLMDSTSGLGSDGCALKNFKGIGTIGKDDAGIQANLPIGHYAFVEEHHQRAIRAAMGIHVYLIEQDWNGVRITREYRANRSECSVNTGSTVEKAVSIIGFDNLYIGHYKYMDLFLNEFFKRALLRDLEQCNSAGIAVAHGDKAYGYRREWEAAGIPFNHGVCLFMLTYQPFVSSEGNVDRGDWVIKHYDQYKYILKTIESDFKHSLETVTEW